MTAARVEAWLDDEHTAWERDRGVIERLRELDAEPVRAWAVCPRADDMMAIAGAYRLPHGPVVKAAVETARAALPLVQKSEIRPRRAVHAASNLTVDRPLDTKFTRVMAELWNCVEHLDADAERMNAAWVPLMPRWRAAVESVVDGVLAQVVREATENGTPHGEVIARVRDEVAMALEHNEEFRRILPRETARQSFLAHAHASRAALSSLTVAQSANVAVQARNGERMLLDQGRADDAAQTRIIAARSDARVFTEAALVFHHAALAYGRHAVASEWVASGALRAFCSLIGQGIDRSSPPALQAFDAVIEARFQDAADAKARELAEALREVIPFTPS